MSSALANQSLSILDTNCRTVIKYALQNGVHEILIAFHFLYAFVQFIRTKTTTRFTFYLRLNIRSIGYRLITMRAWLNLFYYKKDITAKEFRI